MNFKHLKGCIILGLAVFTTSQVQADNYNGITQCYLFKNDKLQSKSTCQYKGKGFYASYGHNSKITFTSNAFKMPYIVASESELHDGEEEGSEFLNNKPATTYYRYSNLKKATDLKVIDIAKMKLLTCSMNKQGQDFCYDETKLASQ